MAVLGYESLGDIHAGHDLDAPDQCRLKVLRGRSLLYQNPVHAVLDFQFILEWLDVNIGRTGLNGFEQQQVDEMNQRGLLGHAMNVFRIDGLEIVFEIAGIVIGLSRQAFRHAGRRGAVMLAHEIGKQA